MSWSPNNFWKLELLSGWSKNIDVLLRVALSESLYMGYLNNPTLSCGVIKSCSLRKHITLFQKNNRFLVFIIFLRTFAKLI